MNFTFRTPQDTRDLAALTSFLHAQHLGYPHYDDWVERCKAEVDAGYKTAVLAFYDSKLIADLIWQPHKDLPRVRELKNMRVDPRLRDRYVARFLLKQAEVEQQDDFDVLMGDLRDDQPEMFHLLLTLGYVPLHAQPLYDTHHTDTVMVKRLERSKSGLYH